MFNGVEFYGLNTRQGLESDLVVMTKHLHQYFPETESYIVFEDVADCAYILVDTEDCVFYYLSDNEELIDLKKKLFDYILERFEFELEMDEDME